MANTQALVTLIEEFPQAFKDPEQHPPMAVASEAATQPRSSHTRDLLALVAEFPEAFADSETAPSASEAIAADSTVASPVAASPEPTTSMPQPALPFLAIPPGYQRALRRQLSTFTWGMIEVYLTYEQESLRSLWLTVGKSGTEIQSLCEAIARLVNLLLAQQTPVAEITRELRGIRGADSEGLGPNRILGLADLIGKVLQEAPTRLEPGAEGQSTSAQVTAEAVSAEPAVSAPSQAVTSVDSGGLEFKAAAIAGGWTQLSEATHAFGLCPECGAELQAMNGCSGGACQVCGYSSCS